MAGPTADFTAADAAEFVSSIHDVMNLGAPPQATDRATFYWEQDKTFSVATPDGKPYDWTSAPASEEPEKPPVQVPVAVEYLDAGGNVIESTVGQFNASRARLTFVQNYDQVANFDWVTIGPNTFLWQERIGPEGLGTVEIIQVIVRTPDSDSPPEE